MAAVDAVLDSVIAQSLQDARALSVRAQDAAAAFHNLAISNALALQHQSSLMAASYAGNHLRRGSELSSQEAVAEGSVYKGESLASFPQTESQNANALAGVVAKLAEAVAAVQQFVKVAQSTPVETGKGAV